MRVLILSKEGDGCSLAWQLVQEGHHVDLWIKDLAYRDVLRGMVNRVESFRPCVSKADLVICDMVGFSIHAPMIQKLGKPLLCCNELMDVLELDRIRASVLLAKLGIPMPKHFEFDTPGDALALEWANPHGYVIKPCGNLHVGLTYMCESRDMYEWALSTFHPQQPLLIQAIIPKEGSVEVSTEGWWNGTSWLHPFNHTFEDKRMLNGDLGPMTGCQGNIVYPLRSPNKLVRETVMKLEPVLKKTNYRGPIDVNCIVTEKELFALELTCRFGYDALEALMHGMREPVGTFMHSLAMGTAKEIQLSSYDYLMALRMSRAPYPHEDTDNNDIYIGGPVEGLVNPRGPHVYPCDVQLIGSTYRYTGADGVVCKVASNGRDVREAQRRCYSRAREIKFMDVQYRTDIGNRVDKDLSRLKQWGWV